MVKMSETSKEFLRQHLPEVVDAKEPSNILGPLYDLIMYKGFVSHEDGYNDFGREAQRVYDDIFYGNFEE